MLEALNRALGRRQVEAELLVINTDQGSQYHAQGICRCSKALAELCRVVVLQFFPRNELNQLDEAILTREFATEVQEKVCKRKQMTTLKPVNIENHGPKPG